MFRQKIMTPLRDLVHSACRRSRPSTTRSLALLPRWPSEPQHHLAQRLRRISGEEYKQALYRGDLRIDCSRITLTQNTSDNPLVFSGNGYICQLADGAIRFHMFAHAEDESLAAALLHASLTANLLAKENHPNLRSWGVVLPILLAVPRVRSIGYRLTGAELVV